LHFSEKRYIVIRLGADMKNLKPPDKISLKDIIAYIQNGNYIIPDFQRDFDWSAADICDLLRSIFSDYYIGNLLVLAEDDKKNNSSIFECGDIKWFKPPNHRKSIQKRYIVLDGQQRLSSLHYAFLAPEEGLQGRARSTKFYINCKAFYNDDMDNAFFFSNYQWQKDKYSKKDEQIKDAILPVADLMSCCYDRGNRWFDDLYALHPDLNGDDDKAKLEDCLVDIINNYNVALIELDKDIDTSRICEIFEKLNSTGRKLDTFDLLNAILRKDEIKLRKDLWEKAENEDNMDFLGGNGILVLQTMSIIKQTYCAPKFLYYLVPKAKKIERGDNWEKKEVVLIEAPEEFIALWEIAINALQRATERLKLYGGKYGVISQKLLAYTTILPLFSALLYYLESKKLLFPITEDKLRKWYFASLLGKRYDGSTNTTTAKDYKEMLEWFEDDSKKPEALSDIENVENIERLLPTTTYKAAPYTMILNAVIIKGAKDFFTGNAPVLNELNDHHIIPYSRWKELGVPQHEINTIFNRTLISDKTNKSIGNDYPVDYLKRVRAACGEEYNAVMESHFISNDALAIIDKPNLTKDDFYAFINERRKTIIDYLKNNIFNI
jgi:hypothetical protein